MNYIIYKNYIKNYRWFLLPSIVFMALSLFLLLSVPLENHIEFDSLEYLAMAKNFQETGNLGFHPRRPHEMPAHTAGYPLFLGFLFALVGQSILLVLLIQILLCLLIAVMLYALAYNFINPAVARLTFVLTLLNIGFIVYAQFIYSELLLVTFLVGFIYYFLNFYRYKTTISLIVASVLLLLSVLVKPHALFFIPLLIIVILFMNSSWLASLYNAIIFGTVFYSLLLGYMAYNYRMYGEFRITTLVNENLFCFLIPRHIVPLLPVYEQEEIMQTLPDRKLQMKGHWSLLFDLAYKHPIVVMCAWMKNVLKTYVGLYATALKVLYNPTIQQGVASFFNQAGSSFVQRLLSYITCGTESWLLWFIVVCEILSIPFRYFFVLIGIGWLLIERKYFLAFFISLYIFYFSFVTGHDGCGRFRLTFEPLLILTSSIGLYYFWYCFSLVRNFTFRYKIVSQKI